MEKNIFINEHKTNPPHPLKIYLCTSFPITRTHSDSNFFFMTRALTITDIEIINSVYIEIHSVVFGIIFGSSPN